MLFRSEEAPTLKIKDLINVMAPDDRADLFQRLDEDDQQELLPLLEKEERDDLNQLLAYKEDTAGSIMTTDFAVVEEHWTAKQALLSIRLQAPEVETIYYLYVVDIQEKLKGTLSLRDLVMAPPRQEVSEIMSDQPIAVKALDDQENVAKAIAKYDLLAIPVVDEKGVLVGIITHDDALDIIQEEQTEDIEKFMGFTGAQEEDTYLSEPIWNNYKRRIFWVIGLACLSQVSGLIIRSEAPLLQEFIILTTFMTMLVSTGGNVGSQSATVVIRGLALDQIRLKDAWRIILKELGNGVLLAVTLGMFSFAIVLIIIHGTHLPQGASPSLIAICVSLAMVIQIVTASFIGVALPLVAQTFKIDPALVASPALATLVDICGLFIYFHIAHLVLY